MPSIPRILEETRSKSGAIELVGWEPPASFIERQLWESPRWVYALSCPGFYKIGQAKNVDDRIKQIQRSCPLELKKLTAVKVPRIGLGYAEAYAHSQMGTPIRGEWYSAEGVSDSAVKAILLRAQRRGKAFLRHCELAS